MSTSDLRKLIGSQNVITPRLTQWLVSNGEVNLTNPEVRERMVEIMSADHHRAKGWHPSTIMSCKRAQVFEWLGVPSEQNHSVELLNIFADGTWRHLRWQTMLLTAGILTDVEIPVSDEATGLVGSMDGEGEYKGDKFMFELKGIFQLNDSLPYSTHLWQVNAYLLMRPDLDYCVMVYEDKRTQNWREYKVTRSAQHQKSLRRRCESLNNHVATKELPIVQPECVKETGPEWKGCPYQSVCKSFGSWGEAEEAAGADPF